MGLSTPKRRAKLSHDPNNTTWSKSTSNYGHRILSAQGWKQGDYLGAPNASHSDHYTAANSSHIRVLLREENLGLGAQLGKSNAETFGLSLFSGVLGRLNGKSGAEVQRQQDAFRDAGLRTYQAQKYGMMNFVSGGLLVGERVELATKRDADMVKDEPVVPDVGQQEREIKEGKVEETTLEIAAVQKSKSKKRKVEAAIEGQARSPDGVKQEKKTKRPATKEESGPEATTASTMAVQESLNIGSGEVLTATTMEKSKSNEQRRKKKRRKDEGSDVSDKTPPEDASATLKQEERGRKEERQKRKEKRQARSRSQLDNASDSNGPVPSRPEPAANEVEASNGNRHAVRQRYIQQKRMALLNPQAMKEIFMLKAAA